MTLVLRVVGCVGYAAMSLHRARTLAALVVIGVVSATLGAAEWKCSWRRHRCIASAGRFVREGHVEESVCEIGRATQAVAGLRSEHRE